MYCHNCGNAIDDDANHCKHCGQPVKNYGRYATFTNLREKEVGVGLIIALLVIGGGQMYAGKIARGFIILLAWVFLFIPVLALIIISDVVAGPYGGAFAVIAAFVIYIGYWVWSIYDAKITIERYNEALRNTGRPPW
ncbi:MAG: zinc ribbon domain-containing protein [Methanomassiliicoccaceae archaeon]|nr:zinc ribbon domain-containing protein [Methanomassiliicoccaceae archaeon]